MLVEVGYCMVTLKHENKQSSFPTLDLFQTGMKLLFQTGMKLLRVHRVATCQGNAREKLNFLQVREKSGNFEKMSGNFGHLTHVRELSGNFVISCQGIVREFCHDIIFRLKLPSYDKALPGLCLCKCLLGKYKLKVY